MNINKIKFFVFFFALAIAISVHAERTLRTDNLTPRSETIISESDIPSQEIQTRTKRNDTFSSLKIENAYPAENKKIHRLSKKINSESKVQNRISRVSNFSPENKKLLIKENVSRKYINQKNNLVRTTPPWQAPRLSKDGNLNFDASSGDWYQYFFDGFEGAFPASWDLYGTPTWGPTDSEAQSGSKSAWCAGYDYSPAGNYFDNMDAWIIHGPFDLSASEDALLFFDFTIKSQPDVDKLFVGLSTDGDNFSGNVYTGDSGGWISNVYIDAKSYAFSNSVYIGFQFYSNETISNYAGAFVDNIELMGYQSETNTNPDLAVQNAHITDSFNGMFNFQIKNNSAQNQPPDSYYISVFVDEELDSKETNQYELASGATTTWDWQLAYYYLPGEHKVEILVEPAGGDVNTNDNSLSFTLVITNATVIDLGVSNPVSVNPAQGYFDFDVDNYGPAIAIADSYLISVSVDGEFDSSARNTEPLYPYQYTTWEWATDYIYPAGDHAVEVTVESDITDIDPGNDTVSFTMSVPSGLVVTDLKVSGLKITDEKNAVFKFKVKNKGPKACDTGDYTIRVYVDGLEDSTKSNTKIISKGMTAIWEWQLAYTYPPGLHKIEIDVRSSGGDLKPEDNTLLFQMTEFGANLQVYNIPVFTSVVENSFSAMLTATNGSPPYSWAIFSGTLPQGIYLAGNGVLFGTPATAGNYSFKVKCSDASDASAFADVSIVAFNSPPALPEIIDTILPVTFENTFFQMPIYAVGGTIPYNWSFNGSTPAGINISSTGSVYGTITSSGEYKLPVKVTDDTAATDDANLSLRVLETAQTINYQLSKLQIIIPWKDHSAGNDDTDSIKLKAEFPIPGSLVVDSHTKLTIFVGDYPFSFIKPSKAKFRKKATFKTEKNAAEKGKASVKWLKDKIRVTLSMKNVNLAAPLAKYGVKENASGTLTIPVRISINDCDSGYRDNAVTYTQSKSRKGKLKN